MRSQLVETLTKELNEYANHHFTTIEAVCCCTIRARSHCVLHVASTAARRSTCWRTSLKLVWPRQVQGPLLANAFTHSSFRRHNERPSWYVPLCYVHASCCWKEVEISTRLHEMTGKGPVCGGAIHAQRTVTSWCIASRRV